MKEETFPAAEGSWGDLIAIASDQGDVQEVEKSTHRAEVFRISEIFPHPNADRLEVIHFFGYSCAVRKDDFQPGDLAVYVPPDSLVPVARPEFEWLADKAYGEANRYSGFARIRAQRLRGHISQGLIIPAPSFLKEGDDAAPSRGWQLSQRASRGR
jgi:RNA ligase (TIGR02306 family)